MTEIWILLTEFPDMNEGDTLIFQQVTEVLILFTEFPDINYERLSRDFVKASVLISSIEESLSRLSVT